MTAGGSQRGIADRCGIDRSTGVHITGLAEQDALEGLANPGPGRSGKPSAELTLEDPLRGLTRRSAALRLRAMVSGTEGCSFRNTPRYPR